MAITVEDGTGKTTADAFISVAYAKSYFAARGRTYTGVYTDAQIETAIVRATDYLSESFRWAGFKVKGRNYPTGEQALAWPRTDVVDRDGYSVAYTTVPVEVQRATAEVAWYELANPGAMAATYTPHGRVKSRRVGPIAVEYDLGRRDASGARPVILAVRDLIGPFLKSGTSRIVGGAVRG